MDLLGEHKCGDQEGVAALSAHYGSDLLRAILNIGCKVEGAAKAFSTLVFT